MKTYASIYIGTYETVLEIFEISKNKKIKRIDSLRKRCELSDDIGKTGSVSFASLDLLVATLKNMKNTVKTYQCDDCEVYAGYTLAKADNYIFILDQIRLKTNLDVNIMSNSEQRFMTYVAIAAQPDFDELISDHALLVDIGGSSLQITLFEKGEIITTEHILLGSTLIMESLLKLKDKKDADAQVSELIKKELSNFSNIYLKKQPLNNLILVNNQIHNVTNRFSLEAGERVFSAKDYERIIAKIKKKQLYSVISETLDTENEDEMLFPSILLYQAIIEQIPSEQIIIPDVSVTDGFAHAYAYRKRMFRAAHNFEEDILSACWAIAKRYDSHIPHLKSLLNYSMQIFDVLKKEHKLTQRDRLLLQAVCILHDCGKYISISLAADCTYTIIMSTEILGLSHSERLMIANVCASNRNEILPFDELSHQMSREDYIRYLKLSAILRVANAMDRSHRQKLKKTRMVIKDNQLIITVEADDPISMEKGLFETKADFFESVFRIRPILKETKD